MSNMKWLALFVMFVLLSANVSAALSCTGYDDAGQPIFDYGDAKNLKRLKYREHLITELEGIGVTVAFTEAENTITFGQLDAMIEGMIGAVEAVSSDPNVGIDTLELAAQRAGEQDSPLMDALKAEKTMSDVPPISVGELNREIAQGTVNAINAIKKAKGDPVALANVKETIKRSYKDMAYILQMEGMLRSLINDPDPNVRQVAFESMVELGHPEFIDILADRGVSDMDNDIAIFAMEKLFELKGAEAEPFIRVREVERADAEQRAKFRTVDNKVQELLQKIQNLPAKKAYEAERARIEAEQEAVRAQLEQENIRKKAERERAEAAARAEREAQAAVPFEFEPGVEELGELKLDLTPQQLGDAADAAISEVGITDNVAEVKMLLAEGSKKFGGEYVLDSLQLAKGLEQLGVGVVDSSELVDKVREYKPPISAEPAAKPAAKPSTLQERLAAAKGEPAPTAKPLTLQERLAAAKAAAEARTRAELPFEEKFTLEEEIGRGAFGVVHKATDKSTNKPVAVKTLLEVERLPSDTDQEYEARVKRIESEFDTEMNILDEVDHPNIAGLIETGVKDGKKYYAQEYREGDTLFVRGKARQHGLDEILDIGGTMAGTVGYLHREGVVHNDVKLENVIVDEDGHLTLIDFGLARKLDKPGRKGTFRGTPAYLSPERLKGEETPAGDIYALGVMLYELSAGMKSPFARNTQQDTLAKIKDKSYTPPPPSDFNSDIPGVLSNLIMRMMDRDPTKRPTMAEVEQTLADIKSGKLKDPPTLFERAMSGIRNLFGAEPEVASVTPITQESPLVQPGQEPLLQNLQNVPPSKPREGIGFLGGQWFQAQYENLFTIPGTQDLISDTIAAFEADDVQAAEKALDAVDARLQDDPNKNQQAVAKTLRAVLLLEQGNTGQARVIVNALSNVPPEAQSTIDALKEAVKEEAEPSVTAELSPEFRERIGNTLDRIRFDMANWGYGPEPTDGLDELTKIGEPAVPILIEKLLDPQAKRDHEAIVRVFGRIGDARAVDPLIEKLQDPQSNHRIIIKALGNIGDARAVDSLIEKLSASDRDVRWDTAVSLGDIGSDRAVDALIIALNDDDVLVQSAAASALGKIGDARAVEALIKLVDGYHDIHVRPRAVDALGSIGDVRAVETLIQALPDTNVRAAEALNKIRNVNPELSSEAESLVKDMIKGYKKADHITRLHEIGEPAIPFLVNSLFMEHREHRSIVEVLKGFDAQSLTPYVGSLTVAYKYRESRSVGGLLVKIGAPSADHLVNLFSLKASYERGYVGDTLVKIGAPAVSGLLDLAPTDDADLRLAVFDVLSKIGTPAIDALRDLTHHPTLTIRINAVEALGKIGGERSVDHILARMADSNEHPSVRLTAINTVNKLGDPRALQTLIKIVNDPSANDDILSSAIQGLEKLNVHSKQLEPFADHSSVTVRLAVVKAAGQLEGALPLLAKAVRDQHKDVRSIAARHLTDLGDDGIKELVSALSDDSSLVRLSVVERLGELYITKHNNNILVLNGLIDALRDSDADVSSVAERGLLDHAREKEIIPGSKALGYAHMYYEMKEFSNAKKQLDSISTDHEGVQRTAQALRDAMSGIQEAVKDTLPRQTGDERERFAKINIDSTLADPESTLTQLKDVWLKSILFDYLDDFGDLTKWPSKLPSTGGTFKQKTLDAINKQDGMQQFVKLLIDGSRQSQSKYELRIYGAALTNIGPPAVPSLIEALSDYERLYDKDQRWREEHSGKSEFPILYALINIGLQSNRRDLEWGYPEAAQQTRSLIQDLRRVAFESTSEDAKNAAAIALVEIDSDYAMRASRADSNLLGEGISADDNRNLFELYKRILSIQVAIEPFRASMYAKTAYELWFDKLNGKDAPLDEGIEVITSLYKEPSLLRDDLLNDLINRKATTLQEADEVSKLISKPGELSDLDIFRDRPSIGSLLEDYSTLSERSNFLKWLMGIELDRRDQNKLDRALQFADVKESELKNHIFSASETEFDRFVSYLLRGGSLSSRKDDRVGILNPHDGKGSQIEMDNFLNEIFDFYIPVGAVEDDIRSKQRVVFNTVFNSYSLERRIEIYLSLMSLKEQLQDASMGDKYKLFLGSLGAGGVKAGQFLSEQAGIIENPALRDSLGKLKESVKPFEKRGVFTALQGSNLEAMVSGVGRRVAAASIKQVHLGESSDGKDIVLKVKRPKLDEQIEEDFRVLEDVVETLTKEGVALPDMVDFVREGIESEMDFGNEIRASERMRGLNYRSPEEVHGLEVKFAETYGHSDSIIIEDAVHGITFDLLQRIQDHRDVLQLADRDEMRSELEKLDFNQDKIDTLLGFTQQELNNILSYDVKNIADLLLDNMLYQIFGAGFFHGDPHGGNFMITPNNEVYIIDLGDVGEISSRERNNFGQLMIASSERDADLAITNIETLLGEQQSNELRNKIRDVIESDDTTTEKMKAIWLSVGIDGKGPNKATFDTGMKTLAKIDYLTRISGREEELFKRHGVSVASYMRIAYNRVRDYLAWVFEPAPAVEPEQITSRAQELLGREISAEQADALAQAHLVGTKEGRGLGPRHEDGTYKFEEGTFTFTDIKDKDRILAAAGFTHDEIKKLMDYGIVGLEFRLGKYIARQERDEKTKVPLPPPKYVRQDRGSLSAMRAKTYKKAVAALGRPGSMKAIAEAETLLDRPLTHVEAPAIVKAHKVGRAEGRLLGKRRADGTYAKHPTNPYTTAELLQKARILDAAGFNADQRRVLIEHGVVGNADASLEPAVAELFPQQRLAQLEREVERELAVEDLRKEFETVPIVIYEDVVAKAEEGALIVPPEVQPTTTAEIKRIIDSIKNYEAWELIYGPKELAVYGDLAVPKISEALAPFLRPGHSTGGFMRGVIDQINLFAFDRDSAHRKSKYTRALVDALSEINTPKSNRALLEVIGHQDISTRDQALERLLINDPKLMQDYAAANPEWKQNVLLRTMSESFGEAKAHMVLYGTDAAKIGYLDSKPRPAYGTSYDVIYLLHDSSPGVRIVALETIAETGSSEVLLQVDRMRSDLNPEVRAAADAAMARLQERGVKAMILFKQEKEVSDIELAKLKALAAQIEEGNDALTAALPAHIDKDAFMAALTELQNEHVEEGLKCA